MHSFGTERVKPHSDSVVVTRQNNNTNNIIIYKLTYLHQITEFLYEMEEECNLNNGNDCSVITIGTSYEDRELNLIKVKLS